MAETIESPFTYIQGTTTTGVIYKDPNGKARFCHFGPDAEEADQQVYIENCDNFCSSDEGLLLCHHPNGRQEPNPLYRVQNPFFNGAERDVPNPDRVHPLNTARVLIVHKNSNLGVEGYVFHIVCAFPKPSGPSGSSGRIDYEFDEYNTRLNRWTTLKTTPVSGQIRPETGVSFNRSAYWLTSKSATVYFNADTGGSGQLKLKDENIEKEFQGRVQDCKMQLGVLGKGSSAALILTVTPTAADKITVYQWVGFRKNFCIGSWEEKFEHTLTPSTERRWTLSRSQSHDFQIIYGKVTGFEFLAIPWRGLSRPPGSWSFPLVGWAQENGLPRALPLIRSNLHPESEEQFPEQEEHKKRKLSAR